MKTRIVSPYSSIVDEYVNSTLFNPATVACNSSQLITNPASVISIVTL